MTEDERPAAWWDIGKARVREHPDYRINALLHAVAQQFSEAEEAPDGD